MTQAKNVESIKAREGVTLIYSLCSEGRKISILIISKPVRNTISGRSRASWGQSDSQTQKACLWQISWMHFDNDFQRQCISVNHWEILRGNCLCKKALENSRGICLWNWTKALQNWGHSLWKSLGLVLRVKMPTGNLFQRHTSVVSESFSSTVWIALYEFNLLPCTLWLQMSDNG